MKYEIKRNLEYFCETKLIFENDTAFLLEYRYADQEVKISTRQICPDHLLRKGRQSKTPTFKIHIDHSEWE